MKASPARPEGASARPARVSGRRLSEHYSSLMLYLEALRSCDLPSRDLFRLLAASADVLGPLRTPFERLHLLVNRWGYGQARACSLVSKLVGDRLLSPFLVRLAQAISIGTPMRDFIKIEYDKYSLASEQEHTRSLDKLKNLGEAYAAILTSSSIVSVSMLISASLFSSADVAAILYTTTLMVGGMVLAIVFLIHLNSPPNSVLHDEPRPSRLLLPLMRLYKPLLAGALAAAVAPPLLMTQGLLPTPAVEEPKVLGHLFPLPLPFMAPGFALLALGKMGRRLVEKVEKLDSYYPIFIKTLGEATSTTGSVKEGVRRILFNDYGPINPLISRLYSRMKLGVNSEVCWRHFEAESSSSLIRSHVRIFHRALMSGGRPAEVAYALFDAATNTLARRRKREQVVGYFKGILIPLQGTFVSILTLTGTLLQLFSRFAETVSGYVSFISPVSVPFMQLHILLVTATLTVGNAVALYLMERRAPFVLLYYLGMLLMISAAANLGVSYLSSNVLEMFARLEELGEVEG